MLLEKEMVLMSNAITSINVQIDKKDQEQATVILQRLGISMSDLINMTIKQLIMHGSIPFDVSIPKNEFELYQYFTEDELERTAKELAHIEKYPNKYKSYDNFDDLKKALSSDD